jgi:hypothetical protein
LPDLKKNSFSTDLKRSSHFSNFTENRQVGAATIQAERRTDGRTEMTKKIGALCDYEKTPKVKHKIIPL